MFKSEVKTVLKPQCTSCGAILGDKEEPYNRLIKLGVSPKEAMDSLGISEKNICCRMRFLQQGIVDEGVDIENYNHESTTSKNYKPSIIPKMIGTLFMIEKHDDGREYMRNIIPTHNPLMNQDNKIFGGSPYYKTSSTDDVEISIESIGIDKKLFDDYKYNNTSEGTSDARRITNSNEPPFPRI